MTARRGGIMDEILSYLRLKNRYYGKFLNLSERFLGLAEETRWSELEFLADNRERILNILRYFDCKIAALFQNPLVARADLSRYRNEVRELLDERERIARKIVERDLELISAIDEMKSETISELKKNVETRQQLGSFAPVPPALAGKPIKSV